MRCGYITELKICWAAKTTNEEVLIRMVVGREIMQQFRMRKMQYLGHLTRCNTSQLQLIEGKMMCNDGMKVMGEDDKISSAAPL